MKSTAPASNPRTRCLRVVERGQEDHRGVAGLRIVFEAAACLIAVDARHDDIEQDDQGLARGATFNASSPLRATNKR